MSVYFIGEDKNFKGREIIELGLLRKHEKIYENHSSKNILKNSLRR